jgi:hypothetical protein
MKAEHTVRTQRIGFDLDATHALYEQTIRVPGADGCGCIYCKNYAAQRHRVFPAEFISFLKELGIDPSKEWEAFNYDFDVKKPQRLSLYGGWFLFVGELLDELKNPPPLEDGFAYWLTTSFPTGTLPKGLQLCAVEFLVELPWILAEIPE